MRDDQPASGRIDWAKVRFWWLACVMAGAAFVVSKPNPGEYLLPAALGTPILMVLVVLGVWIDGLLTRHNRRKVAKKRSGSP
jgi:hypothetical protein